jgi:uncharacterized protein YcgL (UPF0745 family)
MSTETPEEMRCWIYRSRRRAEMYLYLACEDGFAEVPDELLKAFGEPELAMEITLTPERRLARADVVEVMGNLESRGFHLQMPPKLDPSLYYGE